jgi:tripartite-type tricarboxylate transporter receptor subunit TctC
MRNMITAVLAAGSFAASLSLAPAALAQTYPAKPVRVIVPVPAGSGIDVVGRIMTEKMSQNLGASFVVENIAGANSNIGAAAAARAAPDGYTLLVSTDALPSSALIYSNLSFDPMRDVQMFATIARAVFILSVHPSVPAQSVEEFVQLARSKPGAIAYGTSGVGSPHHLAMEMFAQANGLELLHVPFKGSSDTVAALLAGTLQSAMGLPSSFAPHVRSGKFRALAVTSPKRSAGFPDIPALPERKVAPIEYESWWGMFAPRGTPAPLLDRLHAEVNKVLQDKTYSDARLTKLGLEPYETASASEAAAIVKTYYDRLAPVIRKAGIKAE